MGGNSKAEQLESLIRDRVKDAINEIIVDNPDALPLLKKFRESIAIGVAYRVTRKYSLLEITDIIHWRKRAVK